MIALNTVQDVEQHCTPILVQVWLQKQPATKRFCMLDPIDCVLGRYLRSISGQDAMVACGTFYPHTGSGIAFSTPGWAQKYEKKLIRHDELSEPVSSSVALRLLKSFL